MNNNWLKKYKPNNLNEYINNSNQINLITDLIDNNTNSLIIKGDSGIGKNSIIKLIAKKYNYNINKYKLNDKKLISLEEFYKNLITKKNNILIINKIDYITTINEKKNIQNINKISQTSSNNILIIYLVEKSITKIVKEINKNSELIELNKPDKSLLKDIIIKIQQNEKILLDNNIINDIIEFCQKDIRRLILILKDLKLSYDNELITLDKFKTYLKYTDYKIKNYNIIDTTQIIINNYDYEKSKKYYNSEKVILPLMIYENYLSKLEYKQNKNLLKTIKDISNLITLGDIIETNIYTDQNWYLQNIHGFITTTSTAFFINKYDSNNYDLNIRFSSDLNKTSLKNINKKNFNNIKTYITNKSIEEILYINLILSTFLINNNYDDIKFFIKNYNLNYKIFDMIIKVNKINKLTINNVQKKIISSILR